jgi:deoxyribodipyrimidine photolyase-like uncharacterized protein
MRGSPAFHSSSLGFMENPSTYVVPSPTRLASNTEATARAKARASTTSPSNSIAIFLMRPQYPTGLTHSRLRRVGEAAGPFTAGCWYFLHRNTERLAGNRRMRQPLRGLERLSALDEAVAQESARGAAAP